MKLNKTLTALAVGASFGLSGQAFAAGTAAGSTVTNTVSLDYAVSGTQQASEEASVDFQVDHKVNFIVDKVGSEIVNTGTQPGSTVEYTFRVINNGNGHVDFDLTLIDEALNTSLATVTGTPDDDVTFETVSLFWDEDKDGTDNSGTENKTFIDALTFDDSTPGDNIANVVVSVKLYALSQANAAFYNDLDTSDGIHTVAGLFSGLTLEAKAAANETAGVPDATADGSLGTVYIADDSGTADSAGVDLVFADLADGTADNFDSYTGAIQISTSQLSVVKTMKVLNDFITPDLANAKAIPGAQIEYTITVENIGNSPTSVDTSGVSYTIADDLTSISAIDIAEDIVITTNGGATTQTVDNGAGNGDIQLEFNTPLAAGATNTIKFTAFIK